VCYRQHGNNLITQDKYKVQDFMAAHRLLAKLINADIFHMFPATTGEGGINYYQSFGFASFLLQGGKPPSSRQVQTALGYD
jgi:hypothetical protein